MKTIASIFLLGTFVSYNFLIFKLIDSFLEHLRFPKFLWVPFILINVSLAFALAYFSLSITFIAYLVFLVVLFLELRFFYRDTCLRCYFCAAACALHFMSARSIVTAVFSLTTGLSIFQVANDSFLLMFSMAVVFGVLSSVTVIVLIFIPSHSIKIINQHTEQLFFMCGWITIFIVYLLQNSRVYSTVQNHPDLTLNQLLAPFAILLGLYVVLFFAIQTGKLLGYKEKSIELQQKVKTEKQYRDLMTSNALLTYEFNLTTERTLNGFEAYKEQVGDLIYNYRGMFEFVAHNLVHPDDSVSFLRDVSPEHLLHEFALGRNEVVIEYRRHSADYKYRWVRMVINLMQDSANNEIKGLSYVKDIDSEKKHQMELQFKAERDSLTGLYNKGITALRIKEYLSSSKPTMHSALFAIDIDNFKLVNDCHGHTFGDAILGEIAKKLQKAFRSGDIIGRIGGDEFIAFMRDVSDKRIITEKAREICAIFHSGMFSGGTDKITVSGSVGIAIFPEDGKTFEQLYKNADIALYASKNNGKDTFSLYDGREFTGSVSVRTEIDLGNNEIQKNFKTNKFEYIFKILYDSENAITAMFSVLELIARHFEFDRGYIFEINKDKKTLSNTFEWCIPTLAPQKSQRQNIPIDAVEKSITAFYESGAFIMNNVSALPESEREYYEKQGIQSTFQFGILTETELEGFIGFDLCQKQHKLTGTEIDELKTICTILSTFFLKERMGDQLRQSLTLVSEMLHTIDNSIYVMDKDTYEILYMNDKIIHLTGTASKGDLCYAHIYGNTSPCTDCPVIALARDKQTKTVGELYNKPHKRWFQATAADIRWVDGKNTCLINCLDITKYKEI